MLPVLVPILVLTLPEWVPDLTLLESRFLQML
jgi:hypothetical protein